MRLYNLNSADEESFVVRDINAFHVVVDKLQAELIPSFKQYWKEGSDRRKNEVRFPDGYPKTQTSSCSLNMDWTWSTYKLTDPDMSDVCELRWAPTLTLTPPEKSGHPGGRDIIEYARVVC